MSAYESAGKSDDWHTPAYIFDALGVRFDMDVAAQRNGPRHVPCDSWIWSDSLNAPWHGFIWMNPPFGHQSTKRLWLAKFFRHRNGIALVPDRTSAPWWQEFAPMADRILFVSPKIKFEREDGSLGESPGTGTCLIAVGDRAVAALSNARALGVRMSPVR